MPYKCFSEYQDRLAQAPRSRCFATFTTRRGAGELQGSGRRTEYRTYRMSERYTISLNTLHGYMYEALGKSQSHRAADSTRWEVACRSQRIELGSEQH